MLNIEHLEKDKKIEQLLSLRKTEKRLGNRNLDGPPNICKVQPSSVLASVKQFLPMMQEANRKLDNVPADDVNIECVSDTDDRVIEMNLALFEHSDEEDDTYTCSSDEESDDVTYSEVTEDNIKITNQKSKKPYIEEIDNIKDQEPG